MLKSYNDSAYMRFKLYDLLIVKTNFKEFRVRFLFFYSVGFL